MTALDRIDVFLWHSWGGFLLLFSLCCVGIIAHGIRLLVRR